MWMYIRVENLNYKKENIEEKYLKNIQKKGRNCLLELGKDFIKFKDREFKDRVVKIKGELEELFFKLIIVSIDYMDKFQQKEMKKIRPNKNIWYNWLIDYIPESKRKSVSGFKDKGISLFKTNTPKQTVYGWGKKLSKPKTESKIRILFISRKKKKKLKIE